jgi:NADPH-dependent 2,4-dienoyl-CoA reductase/sulfur reductase-like enzyme
MTRVCVVGGGTAGLEAAREAERCGAAVTLVERSAALDLPWKAWPDLISGRRLAIVPSTPIDGACGGEILHTEAKSAGAGFVLLGDGTRRPFDAMVAATGCGFEPVRLPGRGKPGVYILDRMSAYEELGRGSSSAARVIVFGEGARGLQVADRLGGGREVRLVISHWQHGEPSWGVRASISRAAGARGVSIGYGTLSRALGAGPLEAVVLDGKVVSCDALAFLPRRVPRVIPMAASTGRSGGFSVDRYLMTSSAGAFAAGGCAEYPRHSGFASTLEDETGMSGRVAGANAAGRHVAFDQTNERETCAFGLRWASAGAEVSWFRESADVRLISETLPEAACTIAFERSSGRVLGVETVEPADSRPADLSSVGSGAASLGTLAYGSSSDISLVSETARLGLRTWRNS